MVINEWSKNQGIRGKNLSLNTLNIIINKMPKIRLKNNSAEYEDEDSKKTGSHICDMPGCADSGDHKAPKDRSLKEYYFFCLEHAQEYNRAWDFFSGMSKSEIENHIFKSIYGDRPTWKYSSFKDFEESLHEKVHRSYYGSEAGPEQKPGQDSGNNYNHHYVDQDSAEYEAMLIMGLEPPLSLDVIKSRYKKLAKKYHPDLNNNDKHAEELLKSINMAYTILKLSYEKFSKLEEKLDK